MGQRVLRRSSHRLLEVVDALVHLLLVAHQEVAPLEVQAIGLRVGGRAAGELLLLLPAQLPAQRPGDRRRDLALHLQHVVRRPAVLLAPQLPVVAHAHELRGDGEARAPLGEAAEEERVHPERPADLRRAELLALEGERRRPRDDAQPREARELVDEALRDPVAQVLVPGVAGRVLERQHGHGPDRAAPRARAVEKPRSHGDGREEAGRPEHEKAPAPAPRRDRHRARARGPVALEVPQVHHEVAGRGVPAVPVLLQALADDALELRRHALARRPQLDRGGVADLVDRLGRGVPDEGQPARRQLVEDDAQAEEVGARVEVLAQGLLGAHVGHRAHHDPGLGPRLRDLLAVERPRAVPVPPREAEVQHLDLALRRHDRVRGLDVPVDDAPPVGLLEGGGHLRPDLDDPVHVEGAARDELPQVLALDVLHRDEVRAVLLADVVDVGDVRVAEGRRGARLALEALAVPLVHGQLRGQDLHGHGAVEPHVPGPVDLSHAPGAQGSFDLVRPETVPSGQCHGAPYSTTSGAPASPCSGASPRSRAIEDKARRPVARPLHIPPLASGLAQALSTLCMARSLVCRKTLEIRRCPLAVGCKNLTQPAIRRRRGNGPKQGWLAEGLQYQPPDLTDADQEDGTGAPPSPSQPLDEEKP